jgi:hypothetical protein
VLPGEAILDVLCEQRDRPRHGEVLRGGAVDDLVAEPAQALELVPSEGRVVLVDVRPAPAAVVLGPPAALGLDREADDGAGAPLQTLVAAVGRQRAGPAPELGDLGRGQSAPLPARRCRHAETLEV